MRCLQPGTPVYIYVLCITGGGSIFFADRQIALLFDRHGGKNCTFYCALITFDCQSGRLGCYSRRWFALISHEGGRRRFTIATWASDVQLIVSTFVPAVEPTAVQHLMFAWDLFREFRDSSKIAKFNSSEFEKRKKNIFTFILFFYFFKAKNRIYMYLHYYVY